MDVIPGAAGGELMDGLQWMIYWVGVLDVEGFELLCSVWSYFVELELWSQTHGRIVFGSINAHEAQPKRHWNFTLMFIGSFAQHLSTNIVLRHNLFINSSLLRVAQALFERAIMSVWFINASATGPQTWSFILSRSSHPCLGVRFFWARPMSSVLICPCVQEVNASDLLPRNPCFPWP